MNSPHEPRDPLAQYGPTLAAVLLAVVLNLLVAALIAGSLPFEYDGRAWTYLTLVLYTISGAVLLFARVAAAERGPLTPARVARWAVSMWVWPLLLGRGR